MAAAMPPAKIGRRILVEVTARNFLHVLRRKSYFTEGAPSFMHARRRSSPVHACAPEELLRACMRAAGAPSFMHARRWSSLVHACAPRELLSACMAHRRSSLVHACAPQELPRSCMRAGGAQSSASF